VNPRIIIDPRNRSNHFAWIARAYTAIAAHSAEMAQNFLDDLDNEDNAMRPYDSISINRIQEICNDYVDLEFE